MRRNVVTVSIALCGLVAALDLGYHLGRQGILGVAEGQAGGDDVILAAANTQNEVFLFLYNKRTQQLASYMQRLSTGLELKAIRLTSSDFNPEIDEYPRLESPTAVRNMKKLLEDIQKEREKEKAKKK